MIFLSSQSSTIIAKIPCLVQHYSDAIMSAMASQITGVFSVYSTVCPGANQGKHQSSASLAFVRGMHQGTVDSRYKRAVTRKMFPFDNAIIYCQDNLTSSSSAQCQTLLPVDNIAYCRYCEINPTEVTNSSNEINNFCEWYMFKCVSLGVYIYVWTCTNIHH